MASVTGKSSTYKDGHKVQLVAKPTGSKAAQAEIVKAGGVWGQSVYSLVRSPKKTDKISYTIHITDGKEELVIKDSKNKLIRLYGSVSAIDGLFVHAGEGASSKADTNVKTEVKELISMWIFESGIEKAKPLTEDAVRTKLGTKSKYYDTLYYQSALKQLAALKPQLKGSTGYTYERQRDNLTGPLYDLGRKLSGKANDNWNPGDVWMIKKNYDMKKLLACKTVDQLNDMIALELKKRNILPISLKQIETAKAKYTIIDPSAAKEKLDMDFSFSKVNLSESFNNFILWTKSGYGVRVGYKAKSDNFGIYVEGRMEGASSNIGAVDKKSFVAHIKETFSFDLRDGGSAPPKTDWPIAKKELKACFDKYTRLSVEITDYKHAEKLFNAGDALIKGRFSNLMSFMHAFLTAPKTPKKFAELMEYCYYSSKKLTSGASIYILIGEG
jgi:hypothetical protein